MPVYAPTLLQRTLKAPIHCSGVGVHSGRRVTLTLKPAEAGTGITFVRTDVPAHRAVVPARWDRVCDTRLCTVVANEHGTTVGTIEHLMAALAGAGIDNAEIELDGPEIPIMDGSAEPFLFLVDCAGQVDEDTPRRAIRVMRPITVSDDKGASATLQPAVGFSINCEIEFASRAIGHQRFALSPTVDDFKAEVSRARTFGFLHEVEQLRAAGLARGGSLENSVVVNGDSVLNEDGLRYEDEFVRHKILDAMGDLALAGAPIMGRFVGVKSGHRLNNLVLRALFADPQAWRMEVPTAADWASAEWDDQPLAKTA
ncbi:MAG: UDP-3-O-acyl-N-acetylglucosamine deacetylase [Pseudomonadota bacterium]